MFAKTVVTQSMIDAVNQVLNEKKMTEDELDETGLRKAAYAAHKSGDTHFTFKGKKYPVKIRGEEVEAGEPIEEGWDDMVKAAKDKVKSGPKPSGDSGMKQGTRYGGSKQKDKPEHDDDKMKKESFRDAASQVLSGQVELDEDGNCVTPPQAKGIAKKEIGKHEKGMHGKKGEVAKHVKKMHGEGMTFTEKLLAIHEAKTASIQPTFTDNNMGEEMTDKQKAKREKIVMSMKKGEAGMKQRYGKNWKNVMYATATKQAMKEDSSDVWEGEELDEGLKDTMKKVGGKILSKLGHGSDADMRKDLQKKMGMPQTGKKPTQKEEVELSEKNDSHTHAAHYENDKGEWTGMQLFSAKDDQDAIKQAHAKCKEGCRLSKVERHTTVKEEVVDESLADLVMQAAKNKGLKAKINTKTSHERQQDTDNMLHQRRAAGQTPGIMVRGTSGKYYKHASAKMEEVIIEADVVASENEPEVYSTDMLRGRVKGVARLNSFKSYKSDLRTGGEMNPPKDIEHGEDTKEKQKISTNPGPVDIKFDDVLTGPTPYSYFSSKDKITSEEVRGELKHIRDKETTMRRTDIKKVTSHPATKPLLKKEEKDSDVPFDKPYKTKPKDITDKSGAKHTPMSRARDLARKSFDKLKKETMLGKISN